MEDSSHTQVPIVDNADSEEHGGLSGYTYNIKDLGKLLYDTGSGGDPDVVVVVPTFNSANHIEDCLESVVRQDLETLSIIVVDDCSKDKSVQKVLGFFDRHASRFCRARLVSHYRNQGPCISRNSGIVWSREPYLFLLDSDNKIRPPALSRLLIALHNSNAAFAYPQLCMFGQDRGIGRADVWDPSRLALGNYIDTMAMICRDALLAVKGYRTLADDHPLEDYDLWCRFAEHGFEGVFLPELLGEYRVHAHARTYTSDAYEIGMAEMALRHPSIFRT